MALPSRVDLYVFIRTHIHTLSLCVYVCSEPSSFPLLIVRSIVLSLRSVVFESHNSVALPDFQTCQMNFVYAQSIRTHTYEHIGVFIDYFMDEV